MWNGGTGAVSARRTGFWKSRWPLLCVILFLVLAAVAFFLLESGFFSVKHITVINLKAVEKGAAACFVSDAEVLQQMQVPTSENMLLMDKSIYQNRIDTHPYLECVNIQRDFPSRLIVTVRERTPCAVLTYHEDDYLIDEDCFVLERLTQNPYTYLVVRGFPIRNVTVGLSVSTQKSDALRVLKSILNELAQWDCAEQIDELNMSDLDNLLLFTSERLTVKLGDATQMHEKIGTYCAIEPQLEVKNGVLDISTPGSGTFIQD